MDVIVFLLNTINRLALACTRFTVAIVVFLLDMVARLLRTQARKPAPPQEVTRPGTPPVMAPSASVSAAAPEVHVHLHSPLTAPMPTSRPHRVSSPFDHPDHSIYITTGSHLLMPHPAASALLERLDDILYQAAFRHGEPFTLTAPLDRSRPETNALYSPLPPLSDDEHDFYTLEHQTLPPPDGMVWVRRSGHPAQHASTAAPV